MAVQRPTFRSLWMISLTLFIIDQVEAYGTGAPDTACVTMTPKHGVAEQTTPFTYQLTAVDTVYSPGKELEMTLNGTTVRAYLIEVRNSQDNYVGTFITDGKYRGRSACQNKAWTHSSPYVADPITFKWKAPPTLEGSLDVFVTLAETKEVYWVKRKMLTLTQEPTATQGPIQSTTTAVQGTIAYPNECGKSLSCYDDCTPGPCGYLATWKKGTDTVDFTLAAKVSSTNRWIALGLSSDGDMGSDSVMECVYDNGNGDVRQSYNTGKKNENLSPISIGLSNKKVNYADGILSCSFTRKIKVDGEPKVFDLNKQWFVFFGQGSYSGGRKSQHESDPFRSSAMTDFSKAENIGSVEESHLLPKLHGAFMIFSWICAASIGIVCATWFKLVWPDTKIGGLHIWFQIHRSCMILTFLVTIAGFVIIFVSEKGQYSIITGNNIKKYHPIFGIITTCLCIINPFMAICRPKPTHDKRWIFNFAHWIVGIGAHAIGICAMFGGIQMDDVSLPKYTVYILYGFVGWYLFVVLALELLNRCCAQKKASEAYEMSEIGKSAVRSRESQVSAAHTVMKVIFAFHILIVLGLAIAIIVLIFMKK